MEKQKLAVIGATGLVGQTFLHILEEKNMDQLDILLFASSNSNGKKIRFQQKNYIVNTLDSHSFDDVQYACFFSSADISKHYVPIAKQKNVTVIDNSSYFRMHDDVKLIAYGVNDSLIEKEDLFISNPNCCIIQSVILLSLLKKFKIKKVIYNTYQSVSGSGKPGIDDLLRCRKGLMPLFYETDISFTCIPKIGDYNQQNYTDEEVKLIEETKKILDDPTLDVVATCVRVPVMFSHGVSIQVELEEDFEVEDIKEAFSNQSNVVICEKVVPSSILSCKNDKVYVGRIRKHQNNVLFYCVADNVRVGAATNAYHILEHFLKIRSNENGK